MKSSVGLNFRKHNMVIFIILSAFPYPPVSTTGIRCFGRKARTCFQLITYSTISSHSEKTGITELITYSTISSHGEKTGITCLRNQILPKSSVEKLENGNNTKLVQLWEWERPIHQWVSIEGNCKIPLKKKGKEPKDSWSLSLEFLVWLNNCKHQNQNKAKVKSTMHIT